MSLYNIYCDESCHLEHDGINDMVLGAVWCQQEKLKEVTQRIKQIKLRNGVAANAEMKWTKISPAKVQLYADLVNYFFDDDDLHFRALVIPDKSKLDHNRFRQDHNTWYYKMYFDMLKVILSPKDRFEIYVDIKDTHSYWQTQKLKEVCSHSLYDFSERVIKIMQPVRSEEIQIMQIVDILIGAVAFRNRSFSDGIERSKAKQHIIDLIVERSGYSLQRSTLLKEEKCNIFIWDARE